ncbi:WXG100 family type VII secretion target [Mycobacterium hubeiense]|uniref:WXG100 family type VII secretion target n=1 Tax=Mycobacterium hubeiense TaxID=1867256 RepID=UPI000C7F1C9D|nr:WXG100 family type VII secretion target [Mycobacterium sp. QGD 101]
MDRSVEVVTSELSLAAARLQDAGQRLQDGLSSVDLETRELLGSGWKGQAASAYGKAWEQWHNGAGQVVAGLQRMSELLTIAANEYAKTDEQAADAVGSSFEAPAGSVGGGGPSAQGAVQSGSGGASSQGSASGVDGLAQQMNLAQPMMQSASQMGQVGGQLGAQVVQSLAQAGQMAAGLAQQAAESNADDTDDPNNPGQPSDASKERDPESEQHGGAAPSATPLQTAPVESLRTDPQPSAGREGPVGRPAD